MAELWKRFYGLPQFALGPPQRSRPDTILANHDSQIVIIGYQGYFNVFVQQ